MPVLAAIVGAKDEATTTNRPPQLTFILELYRIQWNGNATLLNVPVLAAIASSNNDSCVANCPAAPAVNDKVHCIERVLSIGPLRSPMITSIGGSKDK